MRLIANIFEFISGTWYASITIAPLSKGSIILLPIICDFPLVVETNFESMEV